MAALRIGPFGPIYPRTAERLLPDGSAQEATNVNLLSGEIRPIKQPLLVSAEMAGKLAVYRAEYAGAETWRGWAMDVDVAKVALSAEVEARYAWTGDGPPKQARYANFGTVASDLTLGIPNPTIKTSVSHSGGVGAATSRLYCYTFFSQDGEESGPAPASDIVTGKVDGTWAIGAVTAMGAFPPNSGTVTGAYSSPDTTFTDTVDHFLRVGDQVTISSTAMLVTAIPTSKTFKVAMDYSAATAWARLANWNTSGMKRRLYRSAGTTATYQLVNDDVGTTYSDTLTDAQILGDELISDGWKPPPVGLSCVAVLPNGAMVGISGTLVCFSEPYQPHAWLDSYQYGMAHIGIGLAAFGTTVVIGTSGVPYVADGVEPANVTLQDVASVWPCLSKRAMVSVGDGVMYATLHGLAYIGQGGPKIWTQPEFYTREEWQLLDPSSMICAVAEGKVFVRHVPVSAGSAKILVFHPQEPQAALTKLSINCVELYADSVNGRLYLVDADGAKQYDARIGSRLEYEWLSKEYELPTPVNFGAAKVDFVSETTAADVAAVQAAYDAAVALQGAKIVNGVGAMNGRRTGLNNDSALNGYTPALPISPDTTAYVTFTLYSKGTLKYSKTLYGSESFRLPAGYKSDIYSIQLNGTVRTKSVKIAETMAGLRQL